jgi:hypothetical protein
MNYLIKFTLPWLAFLTSCYSADSRQAKKANKSAPLQELVSTEDLEAISGWKSIAPEGNFVETRFPTPPGYQRSEADPNSFAAYLRKLSVKPPGSKVLLYDGTEKSNQEAQAAVINMEIGKKDLQQCADAIIRLRSEYLFKHKKYDQIHYYFTSGDRADYTKYALGYRPVINVNSVSWVKKAKADNSYKTFRTYLDLVFTYAGTASLEKELLPIKKHTEITPGDVLIQGGHPGHGVMVVDVAIDPKTGKKIYLLAQSYMPAQEIHVLKIHQIKIYHPGIALKGTEK